MNEPLAGANDWIQSWPNSLWRATAEPLAECAALETSLETEVCVVGAGYTGLSTALHLAESGVKVVVIDKAQPGWGCSGRNGGQVNPAWKILPDEIKEAYGEEFYERVIGVANDTCDLVFELVDKHNINCDAIRPGYVLGAIGRKGMDFSEDWAQQWQGLEIDVKTINKQEIADLLGTDEYDGGFCDTRGGSVQPLSYARGLAKACVEHGVRIFGNTSAEDIDHEKTGWRVFTQAAHIDCATLVVGCNGYTDEFWPGLAQTIVPVASLISATEPLPEDVAAKILPQRNAVSETRSVQYYYRLDAANRMVFGGRGTVTGKTGALDTSMLRKEATRMFPLLAGAKWEYDWGGYVAMTTHHRPMLLQLAPHAFSGLGYNGRGVAMSTMMGKQLAYAARGETPDLPIEEPQKIAMHRFHNLGIAARILGGHFKDKMTRRA